MRGAALLWCRVKCSAPARSGLCATTAWASALCDRSIYPSMLGTCTKSGRRIFARQLPLVLELRRCCSGAGQPSSTRSARCQLAFVLELRRRNCDGDSLVRSL